MERAPSSSLLTTRDALLGVVVGAIHADGKIREVELREAVLHLRGIPSLRIESSEVAQRLAAVKAALARQGEVAFLEACTAALPRDLRAKAFHAIADVIAADQELVAIEERYLARFATAMQLLD